MQIPSILCCSSNSLPSFSFSASQPIILIPGKERNYGSNFSYSNKSPATLSHTCPPTRCTLQTVATQELAETTSSASGFVETGYIYGIHGLRGEVRVKPTTDFPELRFAKPGTRWLKQQVSGTETLQEIELAEGRGQTQKSWIVRFNEINTVEQAQKLVGSTILVSDDDRPVLEEGEFYTRDFIGMRVTLKESGEPVGTVVNVFNSGASDLLQVKLNQIPKPKLTPGDSTPLVWVPFVEAIVPTVDLEKREMLITPPKGLLELNIRSHERSKKERRELEWKERKKFQRRLIAAKKKLCEMEQQHVFHGFRYGVKDQRSLLADQIVTVNSKLLQQALQNIKTPSTRPNLLQILSAVPRSNSLKVFEHPSSTGSDMASDLYHKLQREGYLLTSNGKVAIFLVLDEIDETQMISDTNLVSSEGNDSTCILVEALLDDHLGFGKIEHRSSVPLVLVCSSHSVSSIKELFSDHDYFAFDPEKMWFFEEEKLPAVSSSPEGHKILMKSPWEFLQRSLGSGGVINLFLSQDSLLDQLSESGVKYIEVCKINRQTANRQVLTGLVDSRKADVGIQLFKDVTSEEEFDVVFSLKFLKKWVKQMNTLQLSAVLASNSYVEKADKDWIDVAPSAANSYEFYASIYSCLDATPISKVCILDSTE